MGAWDLADLAWAAGLFEGEGSMSVSRIEDKRYITGESFKGSARLTMTDLDVVERFHAIVGLGQVNGPYQRGEYQPIWVWNTARFEHVQALIAMFWNHFGERRRARAELLLREWHDAHTMKAAAAVGRRNSERLGRPMPRREEDSHGLV